MVTASLIILNENRSMKHELKPLKDEAPLKNSMLYLLSIHIGELIFLRKLRDHKGEINRDHWWIWIIIFLMYPYILVIYFQTIKKT